MTIACGLTFHHLGLAVERPDPAVRFLKSLGYRTGTALYDPHQNVNLIWTESVSMPSIEIIYPAGSPGPLDELLRRGKDLIYHLCFITDDLEDSLHRIRADGHRVVSVAPPKPAPLFNNECVSFYLVSGFGLIEIIERRPGVPVKVHAQLSDL